MQISISKMDCCANWVTFVFLPVSVRIWFWKPITIGWKEIFEWKRWQPCCKSTFIGQNLDKISSNILDRALPVPSLNLPLRSMDYTHPYWTLTSPRSPYEWITYKKRPSSSLSMHGFILGSDRKSFLIRIASSFVHFGAAYGHCQTPGSPNPLPSIPKLMPKQRWLIGWLCTSYIFTTPNIYPHGMTSILMCNTSTTKLFIALLAIAHYK